MRRPTVIAATIATIVLSGCTGGGERTTAQAASAPAQVAAVTQQSGDAAGAGVTVVGTGTAEGTPDRVLADLAVEVREETVEAALDAANAAATELVQALQDAGVDEDDIQTTDVSIHPEMQEPTPGEAPVTSGYVARNGVRVTVDGVDQAGQVLQQAVDAVGDAARIQGLSLVIADDDPLVAEAREDAFADARATAEQYSDLAGRSLGAVVRIAEPAGAGGGPARVALESAADAGGVPIQPGTQEVSVQVEVTWELQ